MDFRAVLLDETRAFGELIRTADPAEPVPTCPGWMFKQLFRHVGRGNRWAAQIIAERLSGPPDPRQVPNGKPPDDMDAAIEWLHASARLVLRAAEAVGPGRRVWTFVGPRPPGWWVRRRVHEATVHRADAALALGADYSLPAELAADAISEFIELMAVQAKMQSPPLEHGQTLHLHATEPALGCVGEWTITSARYGLDWSHDHDKGDVALRGPATDVLLALTRRRTAADLGLEVYGDTAVWDRWLAGTPFAMP